MTLSDALSRICPGNIQTAQAARQRFSDLAILPEAWACWRIRSSAWLPCREVRSLFPPPSGR